MGRLRAAYGIATAELVGQLRSGVLVGNIVISILFILLLGAVLGLSGAPRHLHVAVYLPGQQQPRSNDYFTFYSVGSGAAAVDEVRTGRAAGAAYAEPAGGPVRLLIDDTGGQAVANAVRAAVPPLLGLSRAAAGGEPGAVQVTHWGGLDSSQGWDGVRLVMIVLLPITIYIFALVMMGEGLIVERDHGTLFELAMAPVSTLWIIAGKLAGALVNLVLTMAVIVAMSLLVLGIRPNGDYALALVATLLMGLGFVCAAYALSSLFPATEGYRSMIGLIFIMPGMFLSGAFLPLQSLPEALQRVSEVIPLTWVVRVVKETTFKNAGAGEILPDLGWLLVFLAVTGIVGPVALRLMLRRSLAA